MVEKSMVSAKIAERTKERLDKYAEKEGISRSQAIGRMLKQGLDVEESDMRLVPVQTDGGTKLENQIGEVQSQIEEQSSLIEKREERYKQQINMVLSLAMVIGTVIPWTISYLETGINSSVTLMTSVVALVALAYSSYQVVSYVK